MEEIVSCCGVVCSECQYYPAECGGCPSVQGRVFWLEYTEESICGIYDCCVGQKKLAHCGQCDQLPCTLYEGSDPTRSAEENEATFQKQMKKLRALSAQQSRSS